MNPRSFDDLSRRLATSTSRRRMFGVLLGGALGGIGATIGAGRPDPRRALAKALSQTNDLEEQGVLLFEALAATTEAYASDCGAMRTAVQQFAADNAALLNTIAADQANLTPDQLTARVESYATRRQEAVKSILASKVACEAVWGMCSGTVSQSAGSSQGPAALAALMDRGHTTPAVDGSNWTCSTGQWDSCCPQSIKDCIEYGVECATGSNCACCLTSLCGSTSSCQEHCNSNECCSAVSSECAMPSDGGTHRGPLPTPSPGAPRTSPTPSLPRPLGTPPAR